MLRWGILSTGMIAKKFAETLNQMDENFVLAGVSSRNFKRASEFANCYHTKAFESHTALAHAEDIDIIYIAAPNAYHFEYVMLCLNAGKHVLCEKPFTINANEAKTLYETAKNKGLFLMDGLWTMHLPAYQKIRALIEDGCIGEVRHLRAEFGIVPTGARLAMKLDSNLGGGALLDIGIYNITFAALVMGQSPKQIQAHLRIADEGTDDLSTLLFTYPNGGTASLSSAIGVKMPSEAVIFGTKGYIHLPNYQLATQINLHVGEEAPVQFELPFEINGFEYQIKEAVRCIESGLLESPQLDAAFSVSILETLDEIRTISNLRFAFEQ